MHFSDELSIYEVFAREKSRTDFSARTLGSLLTCVRYHSRFTGSHAFLVLDWFSARFSCRHGAGSHSFSS